MLSFMPDNCRAFASLLEREILALAISAEEKDARIYVEFATWLEAAYPGSEALFEDMAAEENEHRRRFLDLYVARFGEHLVPIRREHVRRFLVRKPIWLMKAMPLEIVCQQAWEMEESAYHSYLEAAKQTTNANIRKLLGSPAEQERKHAQTADRIDAEVLGEDGRDAQKSKAHRQFVLTYV